MTVRICAFLLLLASASLAQDAPGKKTFEQRCVLCHAGDGTGTDRAPAILDYIGANSARRLSALIREGKPTGGMPGFDLPPEELGELVAYLTTLVVETGGPRLRELQMTDGRMLSGTLLNESGFDAHIRTADGVIHRLRREGDAYREAQLEPHVDWASYNGSDTSNRHSALDQINRENVEQLRPEWFFPVPGLRMIEGTPAVVEGIMYVTAPNQVFALDAETGRQLWEYSEPRTPGLMGDAGIGLNRGVAIRGDMLYTVTDHAHVIALNRSTGELLWDREMADYTIHYGAIAPPRALGYPQGKRHRDCKDRTDRQRCAGA